MPGPMKEPQSYGSQGDWSSGNTGQHPNDPKSRPPEEHRDFYADERESEGNAPYQGGMMSAVTMAENRQPTGRTEDGPDPVRNVTVREGGAKRNSFFRRRDYE